MVIGKLYTLQPLSENSDILWFLFFIGQIFEDGRTTESDKGGFSCCCFLWNCFWNIYFEIGLHRSFFCIPCVTENKYNNVFCFCFWNIFVEKGLHRSSSEPSHHMISAHLWFLNCVFYQFQTVCNRNENCQLAQSLNMALEDQLWILQVIFWHIFVSNASFEMGPIHVSWWGKCTSQYRLYQTTLPRKFSSLNTYVHPAQVLWRWCLLQRNLCFKWEHFLGGKCLGKLSQEMCLCRNSSLMQWGFSPTPPGLVHTTDLFSQK